MTVLALREASAPVVEPVRASARTRSRLLTFVAVLAIPVFVHVGPGGASLGESNLLILKTEGADLPVGVAVAPLALWLAHRLPPRGLPAVRRSGVLVLAVVYELVQVVAWLAGALDGGLTLLGTSFMVQALVPIPYAVLGHKLGRYHRPLVVDVLDRFFTVTLVFALAYVVITPVLGADPRIGVHDSVGPFVNSKALRYFPTAVALSMSWKLLSPSILLRRERSSTRLLLVAGGLGYIVLAHARSSYLIVAVTLAVVARYRFGNVRVARTLYQLGLGTLVAFVVLLSVGPTSGLPRSVERLLGADTTATVSSERHTDALVGGVVAGNLTVLGQRYQPQVTKNLQGIDRNVAQIANSESQFSEAALRAGPASFLAVCGLILIAARRALRHARRDRTVLAAFVAGAGISLWLASGLVQLNLTEAYIAPLTWLLMGIVAGQPLRGVPRHAHGWPAGAGVPRAV